ncbi:MULTISPECIES: hypothetical protein [Olivibacter]|uniref:Uncharacterized protein n=1 Tax=Olivibacter jilunii TaxID=985016 RepID=A0ABW6AZ21_9SPHI
MSKIEKISILDYGKAVTALKNTALDNYHVPFVKRVFAGIIFLEVYTDGKQYIFECDRNDHEVWLLHDIETKENSFYLSKPLALSLDYESLEAMLASDEFLDSLNDVKRDKGVMPIQEDSACVIKSIINQIKNQKQ